MAEFPQYNPGTSEALSDFWGGVSASISKLSKILNMQTSTMTDFVMTEVFISNDDRYRIFSVPMDKKGWLSDPPPVIKINGVVASPVEKNFQVELVGGTIEFRGEPDTRPIASDVITVSATYVNDVSIAMNTILENVADVENVAFRNRGFYTSYENLESVVTDPKQGDYAFVIDSEYVYMYIYNGTNFISVDKPIDMTQYLTETEIEELLSGKESNIIPHGNTATSDNFYYSGRKTWLDIFTKVRSATLSGLSTSNTENITALDTVLSALGKLQGQNISFSEEFSNILDGSTKVANAVTSDKVGNITEAEINLNRVYTVTHSKSGTVHTLAGLPTEEGMYSVQFTSTASAITTDTWAGLTVINEIADTNGITFNSGDYVSAIYVKTASSGVLVFGTGATGAKDGLVNLFTPAHTATSDPDFLTVGRALVSGSDKMPDTGLWYVDTIFYTGTGADKSAMQIAREYTNRTDGQITKGVYMRGKLNANVWATNWTLISSAVIIGTNEYADGVTPMAKGSIYYQIEG